MYEDVDVGVYLVPNIPDANTVCFDLDNHTRDKQVEKTYRKAEICN